MIGVLSIFPDFRHGGRSNNGQPYGCNVYLKMAFGKMFGLTGGVFLTAIVLHAVPATTETGYFPGLRRPPTGLSPWNHQQNDDLFTQLANLLEEQARRRFHFRYQYQNQQQQQQQHNHGSGSQKSVASSENTFAYRFPDNTADVNDPVEFAVNPADPRYHESNERDLENKDDLKTDLQDSDTRNDEYFLSNPSTEDVPYYKLKPPMDVNPKLPANNIRDDLKALLEKLQKDGQANAILNNGGAGFGLDKSDVVKKQMAMDDTFGMYVVALIAGISAAVTVGLIALIVGWYTLRKKAKAAADVEYPAYGVTGPNKDISPSGDRRLAQSAQMYHYQHQKQQIIAMENRSNGDHPGGLSDVESDDDNEEGDYTVYECPGLAPTGEMEVKNPLFLDDTPVTPSTAASTGGEMQQNQHLAQETREDEKKKSSSKKSTGGGDTDRPKKGK